MRVLGYFLIPVITLVIGYQLGEQGALRPLPTDTPSYLTEEGLAEESTARVLPAKTGEATPFSLDQLNQVFNLVQANYLYDDRVKLKDLSVGAVVGMVQALNDRYTVFFGADENEEFQNELRGEIEGIGAYLTSKRGSLEVISVLKGSPAMKAGLLPGDIVIKIGDEYATDLFFYEAIAKIRGPKGSTVNLEIQRAKKDGNKLNGPYDLIKKAIVRDSLNVQSVTWEQKEDGIVYLSINHFTAKTINEFRQAVSDISLKRPRGMVLDLRYNPGGFMDGAIHIASEFLQDKIVVMRKDKSGRVEIKSRGIPAWSDLPLVVLINKGSASASEIVAAALQDNKRAELVGETSFGKGSIQETFPFADGTLLKLTTALWLTPNAVNVEDVGITPDHVIELSEDDALNQKDPQLEKALELLQAKLAKA